MPGQGLSSIHIEGEKLLVLEDVLGMERARKLAEDHKVKAFGVLAGLFSRPQPEDIAVVYEEKRFDAFWRVVGAARFEYKRRKAYKVPVEHMVKEIEVMGKMFQTHPDAPFFELEGEERCVEEYRQEVIVNAQTGNAEDFSKYIDFLSQEISSTDALTKDGTPVVALEAKPAFLVRQVVNNLIKPIQADKILDEQIGITQLALYFVPIYTFELHWKTKDKRVTISYDGVTGELMPNSNKIAERLRKSFTNEEIFEFGKEAANFIPGGGLAMMVGRKAIELYDQK